MNERQKANKQVGITIAFSNVLILGTVYFAYIFPSMKNAPGLMMFYIVFMVLTLLNLFATVRTVRAALKGEEIQWGSLRDMLIPYVVLIIMLIFLGIFFSNLRDI